MTEELEWWDYESRAEMADAVAGDIGFIIGQAIEAHGGARIAVPGGSTPGPIFKALLKQKLDWSRVVILPTDDRIVGPTDKLSNFRQLEEAFGKAGARIVPLVAEADGDYRAVGRAADARLQELDWPLDLAWLGMGEDGHTASIFPGADLDAALNGPKGRHAVGVRPDPLPPEAPVDRVTLTRATLTEARALLITFVGEKKKQVLETAIKEGPLSRYPIGRVLAEVETPVDIHWSAE